MSLTLVSFTAIISNLICGGLIGEIVPYLTYMQQCCMSVLSFGWLSYLEVGGISWVCGRELVKQLVGPLLVNDAPI